MSYLNVCPPVLLTCLSGLIYYLCSWSSVQENETHPDYCPLLGDTTSATKGKRKDGETIHVLHGTFLQLPVLFLTSRSKKNPHRSKRLAKTLDCAIDLLRGDHGLRYPQQGKRKRNRALFIESGVIYSLVENNDNMALILDFQHTKIESRPIPCRSVTRRRGIKGMM